MRFERRRAAVEIPTASLADIAFLLIIFFMLTATFAATRGLDLALPPETETLVVDPVESVMVEVRPDGSLSVDRRPMAPDDLLPYLRPKLLRNPGKPVIVKTDPAAPYGAMVQVLDLLRQGKERLGLAEEITIAIPTEREIAQFWI